MIGYLTAFGGVYWVSSGVNEPWDLVVLVSGFVVAMMAGTRWWALWELRQPPLRLWADSVTQQQEHRPATMVLLSDGDEALLALKIAEGLNVIARGLWRVMCSPPSLACQTIGRIGRWCWVVHGVLTLAGLVFLLLYAPASPFVDPTKTWSVPFIGMLLLTSAIAIPVALYVALAVMLVVPAMVGMLLVYPGLVFSRWLAFGWGGSIGIEITAETCPLGDASITRLAPPVEAPGMRHAYSYDERAAELIADFIKSRNGAPFG